MGLMLLYMLSMDDQLAHEVHDDKLEFPSDSNKMTNGRIASTSLTKDISVNSFVSDHTTASSMTPTSTNDMAKFKLSCSSGKHPALKRVSFGSSKGSMVETLVFESSIQEEKTVSAVPEDLITNSCLDDTEAEREKVRVKFFQQSKPQEVDLPDDSLHCHNELYIMNTMATMNDANNIVYNRTISSESGWDNPFRPGGDLSREADEIVELIKGGKPITPTPEENACPLSDEIDHYNQNIKSNCTPQPTAQSPRKNISTESNTFPKSVNGNMQNDNQLATSSPLDVQRGTIKPDGDASQVEHVTIKKKTKCKCCVVQ